MTMKLLPKSEVNRLKAEEKHIEIEEGRKVAERIDTLRETRSEEEASLERFRTETVERINTEIQAKIVEREELEHGNQQRRREREELMKPLDKERDELKTERFDLAQWEKSISEKEDRLFELEDSLNERDKESEKALFRAKNREELVNIRLTEANRAAKASEEAYIIAEEIKVATQRESKKRLLALTHREDAITQRENNVTIQESDLSAREKALQDGTRVLKDRTDTFERTLKRGN